MHVQDDLNLHILHMLEGTFSPDMTQIILSGLSEIISLYAESISKSLVHITCLIVLSV